jgi:hypothetical protein
VVYYTSFQVGCHIKATRNYACVACVNCFVDNQPENRCNVSLFLFPCSLNLLWNVLAKLHMVVEMHLYCSATTWLPLYAYKIVALYLCQISCIKPVRLVKLWSDQWSWCGQIFHVAARHKTTLKKFLVYLVWPFLSLWWELHIGVIMETNKWFLVDYNIDVMLIALVVWGGTGIGKDLGVKFIVVV